MKRTIERALRRLDELAKYEPGWFLDGYKDNPEPEGEAIDPQVIESVRCCLQDMEDAALPLPYIFPLLDNGGGLYFEWPSHGGVPDEVRFYLSVHPIAETVMSQEHRSCLATNQKVHVIEFLNKNVRK